MNAEPMGPDPIRPAGSRRRRLWEIPHKFHCPVVGVCFDCTALRGLMSKLMHLPSTTTDFVLHTSAVGACDERTPLAEILHKTLEKRYQLTIRHFAAVKTASELRAAWRRACRQGVDIPASLWACWTHPACDSTLEQEIYADIHMIQHQVGGSTRADLQAMQAVQAENAALQQQLRAAQAEIAQLRAEKVATQRDLNQRIALLQAELVAKAAWGAGLARDIEAQRLAPPVSASLAQCTAEAARSKVFKERVEELEKEVARLRRFAQYAEQTIESLTQEDAALAALPEETQLSGKCVLCVGGRTGAVNAYREVVEQSGGRFLHHDGGLEESLHRIDGALAAADIVICQTGCISHNAYWRVKAQCKRTGKACMFVKNSSVSSFGQAVNAVGKKASDSEG